MHCQGLQWRPARSPGQEAFGCFLLGVLAGHLALPVHDHSTLYNFL
jgi:hypothetical protein